MPQILLIAQAIRTALAYADIVIEPIDKAERDLVLGFAVGGYSILMWSIISANFTKDGRLAT